MVVAMTFRFAQRSPGYSSFVMRSADYHKKLAEASSILFLVTPRDAENERVIPGSDEILPCIVRDLRARKIRVGSELMVETRRISFVIIQIGEGRDGYTIIWEPHDSSKSNSVWELSANHEGESRVLFTAKKPFGAGTLFGPEGQ